VLLHTPPDGARKLRATSTNRTTGISRNVHWIVGTLAALIARATLSSEHGARVNVVTVDVLENRDYIRQQNHRSALRS
jgi:hypothetical protein